MNQEENDMTEEKFSRRRFLGLPMTKKSTAIGFEGLPVNQQIESKSVMTNRQWFEDTLLAKTFLNREIGPEEENDMIACLTEENNMNEHKESILMDGEHGIGYYDVPDKTKSVTTEKDKGVHPEATVGNPVMFVFAFFIIIIIIKEVIDLFF